MMKLTAKVTRVIHPEIHKIGTIENGVPRPVADLPMPAYVVIELGCSRDEPCVMYRYTDADEFCGDTWHEDLQGAFSQAEYEYGLSEGDFSEVPEAC